MTYIVQHTATIMANANILYHVYSCIMAVSWLIHAHAYSMYKCTTTFLQQYTIGTFQYVQGSYIGCCLSFARLYL